MTTRIIEGEAAEQLRLLPPETVQSIITSPPYWMQREYGGGERQIGRETEMQEYVYALVGVFAEARRVLRRDGTLWIVLGDRYVNKSLCGLPWRVALALQEDGWLLRSDVIWEKRDGLAPRAKDRPVNVHEYIFLLTRSSKYQWYPEAVMEPMTPLSVKRLREFTDRQEVYDPNRHKSVSGSVSPMRVLARLASRNATEQVPMRMMRDVWTLSTSRYRGGHSAPFPESLAEKCLRSSTQRGDIVLDPFAGSGTVGVVANRYGRSSILIDLDPDACRQMRQRIEEGR